MTPTPDDLPPGFVRRPVIPLLLTIVVMSTAVIWKLLHDLS